MQKPALPSASVIRIIVIEPQWLNWRRQARCGFWIIAARRVNLSFVANAACAFSHAINGRALRDLI
jgi:hypothetical protein